MLVSVLRPMLLPGVASAALYAFLTSWTEFLGALTFLTTERYFTLPIALLNIQVGAYGEVDFGQLVAGAVIAMIPCVVLYVSFKKFYVNGLAAGGLKGWMFSSVIGSVQLRDDKHRFRVGIATVALPIHGHPSP